MAAPETQTTTSQPEFRGNENENLRNDEAMAALGIEDSELGEAPIPTGTIPKKVSTPEPGDSAPIVRRSPADDVRAAIAKKFKRDGEQVPFNGDMTDPENLYGEVGRKKLEPEPGETVVGAKIEPEPEPARQPRMITRKVRGEDVTKTEEQWLEAAQKVSAADSYLEEAKELLTEAKRIKAERAGQSPQRPEGQTSTEDGSDPAEPSASRRPATNTKALIEKIQFGDPEEAAAELDRLISDSAREVAKKEATEGQLERLFNNDLAKSQKVLKDFSAANPEIANNEDAAALLAKQLHKIYRDDIKNLGMDESKIPTNNRDLANWHRWYRVHGSEVTPMDKAFEQAKAHVVKVLHLSPGASTTTTTAGKAAPRIEVNVDRNERRAAIPNQPTRAAIPRRDAPAQQGRTPAKDVIASMRKARGQL